MISNELNDYFKSIFEATGVGLAVIDVSEGVIQEVNGKFSEFLGYEASEIVGKEFSSFLIPSDVVLFDKAVNEGVRDNTLTLHFYHMLKYEVRCRSTISFLSEKVSKGAKAVIAIVDISDQESYEKRLAESLQLYKSIADTAQDFIFTKDLRRRYTFVNPAMEDLFGVSSKDLIGKTPDELFDSKNASLIQDVDMPVLQGHTVDEVRSMVIQGRNYIFRTIQVPLYDSAGKVSGISGIVRDITKEREFEEKLKMLLDHKNTLIQEIHHRVKNNMQIICSMLSLQEKNITDRNIIKLLKDSRKRIRSMALVHEKLYRSDNLAEVNFSDFIHSLVCEISGFYDKREHVEIHCDAESIDIPVEKAIPISLILNELLTNAYDHAFVENESREIYIKVRSQAETACYMLEVSDNGSGFPAGFDYRNVSTFGYRLIAALTSQLNANMRVLSENGVKVTVNIPET